MNNKKRLNSYEYLPLVLDVADISGLWEFQERAPMSWYTHPAFQRSAGADLSRSAKLLSLNGWQKAPKPYREATNKREVSFPDLQYCRTFQRGIQREKNLKMIPRRYIKTAYLRTSDRNGERSRLW